MHCNITKPLAQIGVTSVTNWYLHVLEIMTHHLSTTDVFISKVIDFIRIYLVFLYFRLF